MFNGKAIYRPKGKAAEYAEWACNFYIGCSNNCSYCYLKKGRGAKVLGGNEPILKKCFRDENHALEVFKKELMQNLPELQKHGLFFSFSTDPMLNKMRLENGEHLTISALAIACYYRVPVKILTKRADIIHHFIMTEKYKEHRSLEFVIEKYKPLIAIGFTLTGHDELEPGASTNAERIEAMKKLHDAGFKTFASIEPIIDFDSSYEMIEQTMGFCDLYLIGLMSGKKYDIFELMKFISNVVTSTRSNGNATKVYFKDSLLKIAIFDRSELPSNCIGRDYNIFNQLTN
jgi:DNA repair photolyase